MKALRYVRPGQAGLALRTIAALRDGEPGTDRDGMRNWLPEAWRFQWNHIEGLKRAVEYALAGTPDSVEAALGLRLNRIRDRCRFGKEFEHALARLSGRETLSSDVSGSHP